MKFDVIVGNPPYNDDGNNENGSGRSIWPKFLKKSLDFLKEDGYLSLIHPPKWRKVSSRNWKLITEHQVHYLEMHDAKDGQKTFKCNVSFDWYVLQKKRPYTYTIISDVERKLNKIKLYEKTWLPSFNLDLIDKLSAKGNEKSCQIINTDYYGTDKSWVSKDKTKEYKYPVILGYKDNKYRLCYTSIKKGQFGEPKVICNSGAYLHPLNDFEGKYGMNKNWFGISITSKKEGDEIVKALNTKEGKLFLKTLITDSHGGFDPFTFKKFKKDFWKYFVDENGNEIDEI